MKSVSEIRIRVSKNFRKKFEEMMTILLETTFNIGDIVCHKTDKDKEDRYMVLAYYIMGIDGSGTAIMYTVDCSNGDGQMKSFRPYELELIEGVNETKYT